MRWKANCPECDWSHDYQAHWACKGCHEPTDLFDLCSDRAGICPPCGEVHVRLVCPGCEQWTRFDGWREHEPLTKGEWVGLVAGVLTMLVAGWQVSNHLGGLDELAGALLLLSPIVAGFGVGVLLQWFVDGRISPHAPS